jgi:hypothetical protein
MMYVSDDVDWNDLIEDKISCWVLLNLLNSCEFMTVGIVTVILYWTVVSFMTVGIVTVILYWTVVSFMTVGIVTVILYWTDVSFMTVGIVTVILYWTHANEFLIILSTFMDQFEWHLVQNISTLCCSALWVLCRSVQWKPCFICGCPYFPHFFCLILIWCRRFLCNILNDYQFFFKLIQLKPYSIREVNEFLSIYFTFIASFGWNAGWIYT